MLSVARLAAIALPAIAPPPATAVLPSLEVVPAALLVTLPNPDTLAPTGGMSPSGLWALPIPPLGALGLAILSIAGS